MFEEKPIILSEQMLGLAKRLSALPDSAESLNKVNILANFQKVLIKKPNVFELEKLMLETFVFVESHEIFDPFLVEKNSSWTPYEQEKTVSR